MRAMVAPAYGTLELREMIEPRIAPNEVRVRVRAVGLNPLDWYFVSGVPYAVRVMGRKPVRPVPGVDFAGTVETVGEAVTRFRPGDDVFGAARGALAELVAAAEHRLSAKPANLTFEQAAAVPVAGLTALQALRRGGACSGQKVLIHGASSGVGTFAVQLAKWMGTEVTGVCSTRNVEMVRSIGADHVVDYTKQDFTCEDRRYDLMLDIVGGRSWRDVRRVLAPRATFVLVGGPRTNRWVGPLGHLLRTFLAAIGDSRKMVSFVTSMNPQDLDALRDLLQAGVITPVIDRCYDWSEAAAALAHVGGGHASGKVVVTIAASA